MYKPYVVSADIYLLLKKWAAKKNLTLPEKSFFDILRKDFIEYLSNIFDDVEFISEDEILDNLNTMINKYNLPVILLDKAYHNDGVYLEIARGVDSQNNDTGLRNRGGTKKIDQQLQDLKIYGFNEVILVDDVLFTGTLIEKVISLLTTIDINVSIICTGIGIEKGIEKIEKLGKKISCVKRYNQVIDEICERDFYPGVPLSGRLLDNGNNTGIPYILPFGKPCEWASIPQPYQHKFSSFCLKQTITLFEQIEKTSNKIIYCEDLDRNIINLPTNHVRYVDELKKCF